MQIVAPKSFSELQTSALLLAGRTLGDIAGRLNLTVPASLNHAKGWVGQLLEMALGANAGNLDQPDFTDLGIELKTLPVSSLGQPYESTYICTAPIPITDPSFEESRVWRKMASMLWIPIEAAPHIPIPQRRIGTPIFWSPCLEIKAQLKQDWEELTNLINFGHFDKLGAHHGHYLQIRPKAAHSKTFVQVINHDGIRISTVPKGFYLRATLTQEIVKQR